MTTISSISSTCSTSSLRSAVTIAPTVVASFRAGKTTLTRVRPFSAARRYRSHSADIVDRRASHASTSSRTLCAVLG
jgi:hypothetical protein